MLFSEHKHFHKIKISPIDRHSDKSMGHRIALKAYRKRKYANEIIAKEMKSNFFSQYLESVYSPFN